MEMVRKIRICLFFGKKPQSPLSVTLTRASSPRKAGAAFLAAVKPSPSGGLMGRRCRWQIQAAREQRSGRANASGRKDAPREPGTASREVDCPIGQVG